MISRYILIICGLRNYNFQISREKIAPGPGFEPRTSKYVAMFPIPLAGNYGITFSKVPVPLTVNPGIF